MPKLPSMVNASKITRSLQTEFGSYNHLDSAMNGDIYDMLNLSSDKFPLLTARKDRKVYRNCTGDCVSLCANDALYFVEAEYSGNDTDGYKLSGCFFCDGRFPLKGKRIFALSRDLPKKLTRFDKYIIILPDMMYYDTEKWIDDEGIHNSNNIDVDNNHGFLSAGVGSSTVTFGDDKMRDIDSDLKASTVLVPGKDLGEIFKVGDAVTISGCINHPENNGTFIIREIDGQYLVFYENTFTLSEGETEYTEEPESGISIIRTVPEMDFICECGNRLWGCKGDTIYASKLGDFFNFNVYDGLSPDSFTVNVSSVGDFTGCINYKGNPYFFKEDIVYVMYGDKPANYKLISITETGLAKGCEKSLVCINDVLFYVSRTGVVACTGTTPVNISRCFGDVIYKDACAGTDGTKYYLYMDNCMFVYDTRYGTWHKEGEVKWNAKLDGFAGFGELSLAVDSFAFCNGVLYMACNQTSYDGMILCIDNGHEELSKLENAEFYLPWECEFADVYEYSTYNKRSAPLATKKGIVRFYIRCELEDGAEMTAEIKFDGEELWQEVGSIGASCKKSFILPIIPRRADHFKLKLSGKGAFTVYSITREYYPGSFI